MVSSKKKTQLQIGCEWWSGAMVFALRAPFTSHFFFRKEFYAICCFFIYYMLSMHKYVGVIVFVKLLFFTLSRSQLLGKVYRFFLNIFWNFYKYASTIYKLSKYNQSNLSSPSSQLLFCFVLLTDLHYLFIIECNGEKFVSGKSMYAK